MQFLENGLVPAKTETALFDEVDYVFAKVDVVVVDSSVVGREQEKNEATIRECGDFEEVKMIKEKITASATNNNNNNLNMMKTPNMKFIMVSGVNCGVCSYAKILSHLGITIHDSQEQQEETYYSQIILLNSESRGPFFVNDDEIVMNENENQKQQNQQQPITTWIDYVSMAGRSKIPNPRLGFFHEKVTQKIKEENEQQQQQSSLMNDDYASALSPPPALSSTPKHKQKEEEDENRDNEECPIHIATTSSISWSSSSSSSFSSRPHLQSFFISAPTQLMRRTLFPLFLNSCHGGQVEINTDNKKKNNRNVVSSNNHHQQQFMKKKNDENIALLVEYETAKAILDLYSNTAVYSLSKQFHLQENENSVDTEKKKEKYCLHFHNSSSTTTYDQSHFWHDPCKSIFVSTRGLTVSYKLPWQTILVDAIDKLTKGSTLIKKRKQQQIQQGKDDTTSPYFYDFDLDDMMAVDKMLQNNKCSIWKL